eukprot:2852805-Pleurochrysis_carterae.AAC.4
MRRARLAASKTAASDVKEGSRSTVSISIKSSGSVGTTFSARIANGTRSFSSDSACEKRAKSTNSLECAPRSPSALLLQRLKSSHGVVPTSKCTGQQSSARSLLTVSSRASQKKRSADASRPSHPPPYRLRHTRLQPASISTDKYRLMRRPARSRMPRSVPLPSHTLTTVSPPAHAAACAIALSWACVRARRDRLRRWLVLLMLLLRRSIAAA